MDLAAPRDSVDMLAQAFWFVDKFQWKFHAVFWGSMSLFSRFNMTCLVVLDSYYLVDDFSCPYSSSFAQHGKWITLTAMDHGGRSQAQFFWFQGSNPSSLLATAFAPLSLPYLCMRCSNHEVAAFLQPPSLRFSFPSLEESIRGTTTQVG